MTVKNNMLSSNEVPSKLGLLLVDDEEFNLKALKRILRDQGFNIFCARDGLAALELMEREQIAIIISDMRMPNMSGDDLLIKIDERWPETLKIVLTGYTDISNTLNLLNASSIYRYISKPWDDDFLLSTVHEAAAIYWGKVMDYCVEKNTLAQNEKLQESNTHLRHSVEQSQARLKKVNEKLKSAYDGERRLRRARQEAEKESSAKSRFLATMSHEIRTPLNAIIATNSLLLESTLSDEQKELVQLSLNGGKTLLSLINDILDFSKINADKLELQNSWFDLLKLVDDSCELMSGQVINKPVEIITLTDDKVPRECFGDEGRIKQILNNLISNALKFTEFGCVAVEVSMHDTLTIKVRDTGIGMSAENLKHIFDEFTQVDDSTTRRTGGTGLGLTICKQLTELMGGNISVQSSLNEGSCFSVELPIKSRSLLHLPRVKQTKPECILLSQNPSLFTYLKRQLELFNIQLNYSDSNHFEIDKSGHYAAIFYDLDTVCPLPNDNSSNKNSNKNNNKASNNMDNGSQNQRQALNIALISNDGFGREKTLKQQFFDLVLRKPLGLRSLLTNFLQSFVKHHHYSTDDFQFEGENWQKQADEHNYQYSLYIPAKILVAEDSPSNQAVIKSILKNLGVEVDIANNGQEAVEKAQQNSYDLILMDMAMPIKDGISASKEIIKQAGSTHRCPILALTANAYKEDRQRCSEAGMSDFISKPIDVALFREKISYWCGQHRPQLDVETPIDISLSTTTETKSDPGSEPMPESEPETGPNSYEHGQSQQHCELLDFSILKQLERDTSSEVLPDIISIFIDETEQRIPLMMNLFDQEQWQALGSEAHTLKSSSGSFGAAKLQKLAEKIEQHALQNDKARSVPLRAELHKLAQLSLAAIKDVQKNGLN
ncbi:response regulator [Agaribacterium haliotis]|uniref:response regulator n=1 Tax=Agaribacterium haliotis TaxID=2013869 RepID=UPI0013043FDA|nr:response regulator [Agaribacterium haliotis]